MQNIPFKIAGILSLITACVHLILGQLDLVHPLINSNLEIQIVGEFIGVWHIVTILLFYTAYLLIKIGFKGFDDAQKSLLQFIGWLYILAAIPFMISSIWFSVFALQWILLLPIGVLTIYGLIRKAI